MGAVAAVDRAPGGEEDVVAPAEIDDEPGVEVDLRASSLLRRRLVKDLDARAEEGCRLDLGLPPGVPPVPAPLPGVDPVTTAAVGRHFPEALLEPHRKKDADVAGPETTPRAAGRHLDEREHPDLGPSFRLLDESEFRPRLDVAEAERGPASPGSRVGDGDDEMELEVWRGPEVDLEVRDVSGPVSAIGRPGRGQIELPMAERNRLRIVRDVRRARESRRRREENAAGEGEPGSSSPSLRTHPGSLRPAAGRRARCRTRSGAIGVECAP